MNDCSAAAAALQHKRCLKGKLPSIVQLYWKQPSLLASLKQFISKYTFLYLNLNLILPILTLNSTLPHPNQPHFDLTLTQLA